jgi:hypothetical protein
MNIQRDPVYVEITKRILPQYRRLSNHRFNTITINGVDLSADNIATKDDLLGLDLLSDPDADRILYWNNTTNTLEWLEPGDQIEINSGQIDHGAVGSLSSINATSGSYVSGVQIDANGHVGGLVETVLPTESLAIAGDSGSDSVDLASETLTVSGGNHLTSSVSGQTIALDHDAVGTTSNTNASSGYYVSGIQLDAYGHVGGMLETQLPVINYGTDLQIPFMDGTTAFQYDAKLKFNEVYKTLILGGDWLDDADPATAAFNRKHYGGIRFEDSAGQIVMDGGLKRISWNDGGGNFTIRSGAYYDGTGEKYTSNSAGAATIDFDTDAGAGILALEVADDSGASGADTNVSWTTKLLMYASTAVTSGVSTTKAFQFRDAGNTPLTVDGYDKEVYIDDKLKVTHDYTTAFTFETANILANAAANVNGTNTLRGGNIVSAIALSNSTTDNYGFSISANRGASATDQGAYLDFRFHNNNTTGVSVMRAMMSGGTEVDSNFKLRSTTLDNDYAEIWSPSGGPVIDLYENNVIRARIRSYASTNVQAYFTEGGIAVGGVSQASGQSFLSHSASIASYFMGGVYIGARDTTETYILANGTAVFGGTVRVAKAYTLPSATGTEGQVLKWPGSGTELEWGDPLNDLTWPANNTVLVSNGTDDFQAASGLTWDGFTLELEGIVKAEQGIRGQSGQNTGNNTYTNDWQKVFSHSVSQYSTGAFKILLTDYGETSNVAKIAEIFITFKRQSNNVRLNANIINYGELIVDKDNFEILWDLSTTTLSYYYKPTKNYSTPAYSIEGNVPTLTWHHTVIGTNLTGEPSTTMTELNIVQGPIFSGLNATSIFDADATFNEAVFIGASSQIASSGTRNLDFLIDNNYTDENSRARLRLAAVNTSSSDQIWSLENDRNTDQFQIFNETLNIDALTFGNSDNSAAFSGPVQTSYSTPWNSKTLAGYQINTAATAGQVAAIMLDDNTRWWIYNGAYAATGGLDVDTDPESSFNLTDSAGLHVGRGEAWASKTPTMSFLGDNVGILTPNPQARLHISGTGFQARLLIQDTDDDDPFIQLYAGAGNPAGTDQWSIRNDADDSNVYQLRWNNTAVWQIATSGGVTMHDYGDGNRVAVPTYAIGVNTNGTMIEFDPTLPVRAGYTATGGSGTEDGANTWARIFSTGTTTSSHNDGEVLFAWSNEESSNLSSGIVAVKMRWGSGGADGLGQIDILSNTGNDSYGTRGTIDDDSFKLIRNGDGGEWEFWVKKRANYCSFNWYVLAEKYEGVSLTWDQNSAWQSTEPTGTGTGAVNQYSQGLTALGLKQISQHQWEWTDSDRFKFHGMLHVAHTQGTVSSYNANYDDFAIGKTSGNRGMHIFSGTDNWGGIVFHNDTTTSSTTVTDYNGGIYYGHGTQGNVMRFYGNKNFQLEISSAGYLSLQRQSAIIHFKGGGSSVISYKDSSGTQRNALRMETTTNTVVLSNRGSDGNVQIAANTSTAGSGGEVTAWNFEDNRTQVFTNLLDFRSSTATKELRFTTTNSPISSENIGAVTFYADDSDTEREEEKAGQIIGYADGTWNTTYSPFRLGFGLIGWSDATEFNDQAFVLRNVAKIDAVNTEAVHAMIEHTGTNNQVRNAVFQIGTNWENVNEDRYYAYRLHTGGNGSQGGGTSYQFTIQAAKRVSSTDTFVDVLNINGNDYLAFQYLYPNNVSRWEVRNQEHDPLGDGSQTTNVEMNFYRWSGTNSTAYGAKFAATTPSTHDFSLWVDGAQNIGSHTWVKVWTADYDDATLQVHNNLFTDSDIVMTGSLYGHSNGSSTTIAGGASTGDGGRVTFWGSASTYPNAVALYASNSGANYHTIWDTNGDATFNGSITVKNAYTLPLSDGTQNQAIITDGNGALSFASVAVANGSANTIPHMNSTADALIYDNQIRVDRIDNGHQLFMGDSGSWEAVIVGDGGGSVAIASNDGGGNANLTFNCWHDEIDNTAADQSAARITATTDSLNMTLSFQVLDDTYDATALSQARGSRTNLVMSTRLAITSSQITTYGTLKVSNAYNLPTSDGSANQILTTDGAGNVSWEGGLTNSGDASKWYAAYGNSDESNVTWDASEEAVKLYSSSDTSIGMSSEAFYVGDGHSFRLTVKIKSDASSPTNGLYVRVQEYDSASMPTGKLAIGNNSGSSEAVVQEDTRQITSWVENQPTTTDWTTYTINYTPTSSANWASIVILNWTGLGTSNVWVKDLDIKANPTYVRNVYLDEYIYHRADVSNNTFFRLREDRINFQAGGHNIFDYQEDGTSTLTIDGGGQADIEISGGFVYIGGSEASNDTYMGINQTNPSYTLDVNGTFRAVSGITFGNTSITGGFYHMPIADGSANYVLTTNGSGTVSWAPASGTSTTGTLNQVLANGRLASPGSYTFGTTTRTDVGIVLDDNTFLYVEESGNYLRRLIGYNSSNEFWIGEATDLFTDTHIFGGSALSGAGFGAVKVRNSELWVESGVIKLIDEDLDSAGAPNGVIGVLRYQNSWSGVSGNSQEYIGTDNSRFLVEVGSTAAFRVGTTSAVTFNVNTSTQLVESYGNIKTRGNSYIFNNSDDYIKATDSTKIGFHLNGTEYANVSTTGFYQTGFIQSSTGTFRGASDQNRIVVGASSTEFYTNNTRRLITNNSGIAAEGYLSVGQSTVNTSYRIYVNGEGYATADWTVSSDERKKEFIDDIPNALKLLMKVKPFRYKHKEIGDTQLGYGAQSLQKIIPEAVSYNSESDIWGVKYRQMTALNTKGLQELSLKVESEVDILKKKITSLEKEIEELKKNK